MAKLVFLRRTDKEIEVFGGDVYFDLDGKNIGKLSRTNQEIDVLPGKHTIKMYKSHSYDTFIGFAESTIDVDETEELISFLLANPQQNAQPTQNGSSPVANGSEAEQLKRLKDLLDAGVLTQEEFDAKKKQVLGL